MHTRQDLGKEHSILQYVSLALDVYEVCHGVSQKWEMFLIKPEVKISRQYKISQFWGISLSQQMLDAIRRIIVDNILFFSNTVHQGILRSTVQPTAAVQNFLSPEIWPCNSP